MPFLLIVLAVLTLSSACVGIFTLFLLRRDRRHEREEEERRARTRRLTLRDWRAHSRLRQHKSTAHKQPPGTRSAHKKMIERRNLP